MLSIGIKEGLGLHIHDVHNGKTIPEILMKNALILYVAELFYATALFCAKASILSFYWRMFRVTNIKLPIQILAGSALIWIIIRVSIPIHKPRQGLTKLDLYGHLALRARRSILEPDCWR